MDWNGKPLFKGHTTTTLDVRWTVEETEISRLLTEYILKSLDFVRDSDRGTQLVVQLVMHTFHKLAASSWPALERALQRRLSSLQGRVERLVDLLEADEEEGSEEVRDFALPTKTFFENERVLLETLLKRLRELSQDSKWNHCADLLRELEKNEPGSKVLVFTQYRTTQEMLQTRVASLFPGSIVELINGDIEMEERRAARVWFERGSRFMLSTEAGGEGINLQKACHLMVNYDLPWNPMRLQQRIGRLDRYGQQHLVRVFNLRVPDSWDQHISTRILERLNVIQRTMTAAGPGAAEDYREMILGQVAEQIDAGRLFTESREGNAVTNEQMDAWIKSAVASMARWRDLFSTDLGLPDDVAKLRPVLGSEQFKLSFRFACEAHGIRLRETRNSENQFVPEVFNFDLPVAFRDPIFRPSRTMHVVFDREVYASVRGQDLGSVRGQPIRPVLAGFGEPFTDWLFQTSLHAASGQSAFSLRADESWLHGRGWLLVYALRWMGKSRRMATADSIVVCHINEAGEVRQIISTEAIKLAMAAVSTETQILPPSEDAQATARRMAQQVLKDSAANRDAFARGAAGISLLMVASIG